MNLVLRGGGGCQVWISAKFLENTVDCNRSFITKDDLNETDLKRSLKRSFKLLDNLVAYQGFSGQLKSYFFQQ